MTKEELKAIWAAPIRSKAEYDAAYSRTHRELDRIPYIDVEYPESGPSVGATIEVDTNGLWPLLREKYRETVGVYPPATSVIETLRNSYGMAGQYFPHVSPSDHTMIAYTPDRACAEADRQIKTTIGKFLRKFLLVVTDKEIARLEAAHKADMDPTFLVARTIEEIETVYTTMSGDTGCMRYDKSNWGYSNYHPSAVYTGPGLAVAWLADGNGKPRARAVIYDNPDNPSDKRYVRLYGDHNALRRRLELAGYRMAGLKGAKLKALQDNYDMRSRNTYVMPYLDLPGGSGGPEEGGYVAKFEEDGDLITVIDQEAAEQFASAGLMYSGARSTGGYVQLTPVRLSDKTWTCALTGVTYSIFEKRPRAAMLDDGTTGKVTQEALSEYNLNYEICRYDAASGETTRLRCSTAAVTAHGVPGYITYYNDEATRQQYGIRLLSPTYYKDANGGPVYHKGGYVTLANGEFIRAADVVRCYRNRTEFECHHVAEVAELRKQGFLNASPVDSVTTLVHKDNTALIVMPSGRRAILGVHDIRKDIFGKWMYESRAGSASVLGSTIYYEPGTDLTQAPDVGVVESMHSDLMEQLGRVTESARNRWLRDWLLRGVGSSDNSMYIDSEGKLRYNQWGTYDGNRPALSQIISAIDTVNSMTKADWDAQIGGSMWGKVRLWAQCARILIDQVDRAVKAKVDADIAAAEANATSPNDERFAIAA